MASVRRSYVFRVFVYVEYTQVLILFLPNIVLCLNVHFYALDFSFYSYIICVVVPVNNYIL